MPIILLVHASREQSDPIAQALTKAGWTVRRHADAASALKVSSPSTLAGALISETLADGPGYALVDQLHALQPQLPVVMLAAPGPALDAHKASPAAARAYLDPALAPSQAASEVLRAVRTLKANARPTSGAQAVQAALRELDALKPSTARLPTPKDVPKAAAPNPLHAKVRELESEVLTLKRALQDKDAKHAQAVSVQAEMVRHLELALEALTADLSNVATGFAQQQDRAGVSEQRLEGAEKQLAAEVTLAHELRKELGEARGQLLAAELDNLGMREALTRAVTDASALHERALLADGQRDELIRSLSASTARATQLESELRDASAEKAHLKDELGRLKEKLRRAEAALDSGAPRVAAAK
ncbi:MAG: hypothetical protein JST54_05100 [Deltaproteobacteria bacterium]|nr:hypothetical protein [Deltaproteobacteria bacterium]